VLVGVVWLSVVATASAAIAATPKVTWQTNGRVLAILNVGGVTYVGGTFTQVMDHSGSVLVRSNLAAFDVSGNATTWAPIANGAVNALATDGTDIIAAGAFTQINAKGRKRLAEIAPDGTLQGWKVSASAAVQALAVSGSTVYFGGTFTTVNGLPRNYLAAADVGSSAALSSTWVPSADGRVDAIIADGTRVLVGGFFLNINGASQKHLTALDPTTGLVAGWTSHPTPPVLGMVEAPSGYVYTAQGGSGGKVVAYTTAGASVWTMQTDGNVETVVLANGELIAGGHFNNFCDPNTNCTNPIVRHHIAAITLTDLIHPTVDPTWHPDVDSTLGTFSLFATATDLYLGGDFLKVGGVDQQHFADLALT
jgi:Domain of unknown function (DUF5122) beta-propeller